MMSSKPSASILREKAIFLAAMDIDDRGARQRYLAEECGGDDAMRGRLERMLAAAEAEGDGPIDPRRFPVLAEEREQVVGELAREEQVLTALGKRIRFLGEYELIEELGRGAMGVVFRARQTSLNREVALKVILGSSLASESERERFHIEAEAAANLRHPNIVPIHEIGRYQDFDFYSMALVPGGTLGDKIRRERPDPRAAARLVATLAAAVHCAHQRGVIHRDLKPDNILLDEQGEPLISDFGVACRLEQKSTLTLTGQIMGTPQYMAPEQADGAPGQATTAVDVYSLGAILYELLAGVPPFRGKSVLQTLQMVKEALPRPLRSVDPALPRDLDAITSKCLAKSPARRYASAQGLADDLVAWLEHRPISVSPPGRLQRIGKWMRRKPVHAALVATASLLLLVLGIGGPIVAVQQSILRDRAEENRRQAEAAGAMARERAERNRRLLYYANMNRLGDAMREPGMFPDSQGLLEKWAPAQQAEPADLRGWEWHLLAAFADQSEMTVTTDGTKAPIDFINLDPSGSRMALPGPDNTILVREVGTGEVIHSLAGHERQVTAAVWNHDGSRLASASLDGTIALWDPLAGTLLKRVKERDSQAFSVAWSPDGRVLASAGTGQSIRLWDAATLEPRVGGGAIAGLDVFRMAWQPGGDHLAWIVRPTDARHDLYLWRVTSPDTKPLITPVEKSTVNAFAWSPDGSRIATCGKNLTIGIWQLTDGGLRLLRQLEGHTHDVDCLAWSPDGKRIVSGSANRELKVWDAESGTLLDDLPGHRGPIQAVVWSRRGIIISGDAPGAEKWWQVDRKRIPRVLLHHRAGLVSLKFSPDGKRVAAGAQDGAALVLDVATGEPCAPVAPKWKKSRGLGWTENGRKLVLRTEGKRFGAMDLETGEVATPILEDFGALTGLACDVRGTRVATCTYSNYVRIWDLEDGSEVRTLLAGESGPPLWAISWSPDLDYLLCTGRDSHLHLWETATGKAVFEDPGRPNSGWLTSHAWHPDGSRCAMACSDGTIRIWDMNRKTVCKVLVGHTSEVTGVAWHPGGRRLASCSLDGTLKIWDPQSGELALTLRGHTAPVRAIDWSPDGNVLASAGDDGTILLWDATPGYRADRIAGPQPR